MFVTNSAVSSLSRAMRRQYSGSVQHQAHFSGYSAQMLRASQKADRQAAKEATSVIKVITRFFGNLLLDGLKQGGATERKATIIAARERSGAFWRGKNAIHREAAGIDHG